MLPTNLDKLLGCFFQGEFSALTAIAQRHDRELIRIIDSERKRYPGSPIASVAFDREDVRQILFLVLLSSWRRGRSHLPDNTLGYLRCLLRHTLIDFWRDWVRSCPGSWRKSRSRTINLDSLPDWGPLPDQIVEEREERQLIEQMLKPKEQTLWQLITLGSTSNEMAEELGIVSSTVRARVRRAVIRLKRKIPGDWRVPYERVRRFRRPLKLVELRQPIRRSRLINELRGRWPRRRQLAFLRESQQGTSLSYRAFTEFSEFRSGNRLLHGGR